MRVLLIVLPFFLLSVHAANAQKSKNPGWLQFNVPAEDPGLKVQGTEGKTVFSLVILPFGKIYCYEGDKLSRGTTYKLANQTLRSFLLHKNRQPDAQVFFIKGVPDAYYNDLLTLLRLLHETKTKYYVLTGLTQPEQQQLAVEPDSVIAVSPRSLPDTIAVRPQEAILLFEFSGDKLTVIQKTAEEKKEITSTGTDRIEAIETGVDTAFRSLAGIRTRICIVGDKGIFYASFKKLVDLLRRREQYRYDLLVKP